MDCIYFIRAALLLFTIQVGFVDAVREKPGLSVPLEVVKRTGVTHTYSWSVTRATIAPDGVSKPALLANGQFPGPTLEANVGDTFQITVTNNIRDPQEGTLLHWHGINQRGTPWFDGTPTSETCPIAPGDSFTYTFLADQAGSSWWHSHFSAQHVDGLKGPMIIHGPTSAPYDIDLGAIFLSDNSHKGYHELIDQIFEVPPIPVVPDSNTINGKGQYRCDLGRNCSAGTPYSKFTFQAGKTHLLRVINGAADNIQCFSIDSHKFTVIAVDFTPVIPYMTQTISLAAGQRMDILVKATAQPKASFWMRANVTDAGNLLLVGPLPSTKAVVYYNEADQRTLPSSNISAGAAIQCGQLPSLTQLVPSTPSVPPSAPATIETITAVVKPNASGIDLFYQNGITFDGDYNYPILLLAYLGNDSYPYDPQWNVYNFGSNSSIRIVYYNESPLLHPMHLHGHQFWVLAEGFGLWDGKITNPKNPPRRDVQMVASGNATTPAYIVIEWEANNPGIWGFHCHIAWHSSTGYYLNIMEQPTSIPHLPISNSDRKSILKRCRNWWNWTNHNKVDQIDSGL